MVEVPTTATSTVPEMTSTSTSEYTYPDYTYGPDDYDYGDELEVCHILKYLKQ